MTLSAIATPPSQFTSILPFWFWNGEMTDEEIARQIREMADKGVGGFFICARQGLQIPYLSEHWFEKVRYAADLGAELGLEVWLYDEYPYPSGVAGGEVLLKHPDAKHKLITPCKKTAPGGMRAELELPWGEVRYVKAIPLQGEDRKPDWTAAVDLASYVGNLQTEQVFQNTGMTAYNNKRYFTYGPQKRISWQVPDTSEEWLLLAFVEEELRDFKYYGTYVDPLHKEAMKTFIELTHHKYADALGDRIGTTVKGMFTDEVGLIGRIPWSPFIAEYMHEKDGTDLCEELPALLYDIGERTTAVRYRFYQSIHELLRDQYHMQVHDWCEERGMQYVTEVLSVRMSTQKYSHVPGTDTAHDKLGRSLEWILDKNAHSLRYNPKLVSSYARQVGRDRVLVECFHSVGWSMTLQDAKWMVDRLAALGVNMFNLHAFYYTTDGLTKYDAPPSQFLQNPYWQHFKEFSEYTDRLAFLMSEGKLLTDVAVLHPSATFWAHMGNPLHDFQYCGEDEEEANKLQRLKDDWHELGKSMTWEQREYDHLDAEVLIEATVKDGVIHSGYAGYRVLILPPMTCIEADAWEGVRRFAEGGGTVLAVGLLPTQSAEDGRSIEADVLEWFGLPSNPGSGYWDESGESKEEPQTFERKVGKGRVFFIESRRELSASAAVTGELLRIVEAASPARVKLSFSAKPAEARRAFLTQHRSLGDGTELVFLSNQEGGEHDVELAYRGECGFPGQSWTAKRIDLSTGDERELAVAASEAGKLSVGLAVAPYESYMIRFTKRETVSDAEFADVEVKRAVLTLDCQADWRLSAMTDNIVRLGEFALTVNGEKGPAVIPKTFVDQAADLAKEGIRLPMGFVQPFGIPMQAKLQYPAHCIYETEFKVDTMPETCKLLMERGSISGPYAIYVNGYALASEKFAPEFHYDYLNQACSILPYLVKGRNTLKVEVNVGQDGDGLLNSLYLAGDFGVERSASGEARMTDKPAFGKIQGAAQERYPYYAGTLLFSDTFHLSSLPEEERFEIVFSNWDPDLHECVEVVVNGTRVGVRAWSPYRWEANRSILLSGENQIEVLVTNTLVGMLEGKQFNYSEHRLQDM